MDEEKQASNPVELFYTLWYTKDGYAHTMLDQFLWQYRQV